MSKTRKMLELIQVIYQKQQFSVQELADEFDVSYRTMLRYLHELSGMGIPLYAETGKHGGYRLLQSSVSALITKQPNLQEDEGAQIVIKPSFRAIGMAYTAPVSSISAAEILSIKQRQELIWRLDEISDMKDRSLYYGLVRYEKGQIHYMYAVEVLTLKQIPPGMIGLTVPTQRYVTFSVRGPRQRAAIDEAWLYAIRWLNHKGYSHDTTAYHLEMFHSVSNRQDEVDIYLPLR